MRLTRDLKSLKQELLLRLIGMLLGVLAVGFLGGCAFLEPRNDPTRFYVLTVRHTAPRHATDSGLKRLRLGITTLEVPAYLRTKSMVIRTSKNEIQFADLDHWAESLEQGILRVMKESLGAADNVESVTSSSHDLDSLDYQVSIRILSCEGVRGGNGTGSIHFVATWEARPVGTNHTGTKHGRFAAEAGTWNGKEYGQLAERLSDAVAGAGAAIAADLPTEANLSPETRPETHP